MKNLKVVTHLIHKKNVNKKQLLYKSLNKKSCIKELLHIKNLNLINYQKT